MLTPCTCGRGSHSDEHTSCYECYLDRRDGFLTCIWCSRWHHIKFAACYACRQTPGREDAARDLRLVTLGRDHFTCAICHNDDGADLQIDHIKPCAAGGTADPWNLQTLCTPCNRTKGATWWAGCDHEQRRHALMEAYYTYLWAYLTPDEQQRLAAEFEDWLNGGTVDIAAPAGAA